MKSKTKVWIISTFITFFVIAGIVMFREFVNSKQVFETELYAYLPNEISSIFQINKEKDLDKTLIFSQELSPIIVKIKSSIIYPIALIQHEKENYLLAKVTKSQEDEIKDRLDNEIFSVYPPQEKSYKDVPLFFYMTADNRFFICTFIEGIFIGGFNISLFEQYIDNRKNKVAGSLSTPLGKELLGDIKTQYVANLLLNNNTSYSIFNLTFDNNRIEMNGYDTEIVYSNNYKSLSDTLRINYSLFSDYPVAYEAKAEDHQINDALGKVFSRPNYSFYVGELSSPIRVLSCNEDKLDIYSRLVYLEEKSSGQRFEINYFGSAYRFYTTSRQMATKYFGTKNPVFFTFYKDYMMFSENKDNLISYLNSLNKSRLKYKFDTNQDNIPLNAITYIKDIQKWSPNYFNPNNPITQINHKNIYISSFVSSKKNNHRIIINN